MNINRTEFNPPEAKRTYHFAGGESVTFENVSRIEIPESGTHRVETVDGRKAFVRPEWLWLEIIVEEWTA